METEATRAAFEAAFVNVDCEALIAAVEAWAGRSYRSPENVLEVIPCVQSGMHAFFVRKEDECKRAWRTAEARAWQEARASFDAGMRAFVSAIAAQPNPEGDSAVCRPAIGSGWGKAAQTPSRPFVDSWGRVKTPQHDVVPAH